MRVTWPAHLIFIYQYMHTLAFLIIYDMKVCTFVIEWYVETLERTTLSARHCDSNYEHKYIPIKWLLYRWLWQLCICGENARSSTM
jgi:hypothetical protein